MQKKLFSLKISRSKFTVKIVFSFMFNLTVQKRIWNPLSIGSNVNHFRHANVNEKCVTKITIVSKPYPEIYSHLFCKTKQKSHTVFTFNLQSVAEYLLSRVLSQASQFAPKWRIGERSADTQVTTSEGGTEDQYLTYNPCPENCPGKCLILKDTICKSLNYVEQTGYIKIWIRSVGGNN